MSDTVTQSVVNAGVFDGGVTLFFIFMSILWFILCIALFFKVWGMTNDVAKMKDLLEEWLDIEHPEVDDADIQEKDQAVSKETGSIDQIK